MILLRYDSGLDSPVQLLFSNIALYVGERIGTNALGIWTMGLNTPAVTCYYNKCPSLVCQGSM